MATAKDSPSVRAARAVMLLAVLAVIATGCPQSRTGARCTTRYGQDDTFVLICERGRWTRGPSKAAVAQLVLVTLQQRNTPTRPDPTLEQLAVASQTPDAGYLRSLFGEGWSDPDRNGCDTRADVLIATSQQPVARNAGCTVRSGWWVSGYDGYSTPDPSELDIDHVVALGEAWRSGASTWTPERRAAFYQDTSNLLAVTAATNRSKGDRDPASWQPPNRANWCTFTRIYIAPKVKWQLSVDPAEHTALQNMRTGC